MLKYLLLNGQLLELLEELKKQDEECESVCEIVDIANEEMKKIDSKEIDDNFKKVFSKEITDGFLNLVYVEKPTKKDIKTYHDILNKDTILDIRVKRGYVFYKVKNPSKTHEIAKIIGTRKKFLTKLPINGKYDFYMINANNPEVFKW